MASGLAKGLMYGLVGGGLFGVGGYLFMDSLQTELPDSQAKIEACVGALGTTAVDLDILDPACEDFSFRRSEVTEVDPLSNETSVTYTIYHVPSAADFPAYAHKAKQHDEASAQREKNGTGLFGLLLGGIMSGYVGYATAKKRP